MRFDGRQSVEFDTQDRQFMTLAMTEARSALAAGDYPVGAVLTVDGQLWGSARNTLFRDGRITAHAEHNLLYENSVRLWAERERRLDVETCLYTTLEPCLMCLGTAVLHRMNRIIVACPDPNGGAGNVDPARLGSVYSRLWPTLQMGLYQEESCRLIIEFLKSGKFLDWESKLQEFQKMQAVWGVEKELISGHDEVV